MRTQKLHILNSIYYRKEAGDLKTLISSLSKKEPGFDSIAKLSFSMKDEDLSLCEEGIAIHEGKPSLEPDKRPEDPSGYITISDGEYLFQQLPALPVERIKLYLLPFIAGKKEGIIYIRILKENAFEEVMQFIMPL